MDVKIKDKDMLMSANGDCVYINSVEEILQRVSIACSVAKGDFIYDRSLGSYYNTVSLNDPMLCDKLSMIFKEATIDIDYTDLLVLKVENNKAIVEITCDNYIVTTEVTINAKL